MLGLTYIWQAHYSPTGEEVKHIMGITRNGARTFLNILQKACRLSHLPGFTNGIIRILGASDGATFMALWEPLCALVDQLVALDDHFNRIDATSPSETGGEDNPPL